MGAHLISERIRVFEIPLMDIDRDDFRDAFAAWETLPRTGGSLPKWPGIDFLLDVPPALVAEAMVLDYQGSIEASQYLFWGSRLYWAAKADMTGKSPVDFMSPDLKDYIAQTLMPTIEHKKPFYYEAEFTRADGVRSPEQVLRLPFVDDHGEIDCVLTFTSLRDAKEVGGMFTT